MLIIKLHVLYVFLRTVYGVVTCQNIYFSIFLTRYFVDFFDTLLNFVLKVKLTAHLTLYSIYIWVLSCTSSVD